MAIPGFFEFEQQRPLKPISRFAAIDVRSYIQHIALIAVSKSKTILQNIFRRAGKLVCHYFAAKVIIVVTNGYAQIAAVCSLVVRCQIISIKYLSWVV